MERPICVYHQLGMMAYERAWKLQEKLAAEIAASARPPTLLLLEHPHTITFGRRGQRKNLLWDETELSRRGAAVHWVDRGGDITYHGPGQLVGYSLIPLASKSNLLASDPNRGTSRIPKVDYVGYLRKLERALILALSHLGLEAMQYSGLTGVWVQTRLPTDRQSHTPRVAHSIAKIAALGVKVDAQGISRHGFALNVAPDMSFWDGVIACGLADYPVTSMELAMGKSPSRKTVMDAVVKAFGEVFAYKMKVGQAWVGNSQRELPSPKNPLKSLTDL